MNYLEICGILFHASVLICIAVIIVAVRNAQTFDDGPVPSNKKDNRPTGLKSTPLKGSRPIGSKVKIKDDDEISEDAGKTMTVTGYVTFLSHKYGQGYYLDNDESGIWLEEDFEPNPGVKDCQCSESEAVDLDVLTTYDLNAIDEAHEN